MSDQKSKGLGDTVAKVANALWLDKAADTWARTTGKEDCGCKGRQEKLNRMFPYKE